MKKLFTATLLSACALLAALPLYSPARAADAPTSTIGAVVADFKLPDAEGRERSLSSLKGAKGTAVIFISTRCPVSNGYNERMEKLAQDFRARGVHLVGINANSGETPADIKEHAAARKLTFTILKDAGHVVADRLDAQVTPEAYLLDASNKIVYRGRIDNSRNGESVSSSELREAIEAVLAGRPVEKTEARAFGCSIKRG